MADLGEARRTVAEAGEERDALAGELASVADQLATERRRLAALRADGAVRDADAAAARITELAGQRKQTAKAIGALDARLRDDLEELLGDQLELEGDVPLVLLPVRVEVRSTADLAALRVRIFHDAVHAENLDEGLSAAEREAGVAYWEGLWESGDLEAGWPTLVGAVGARRAPWVAEALRPANLASRPGEPPEFPDTPPPGARQAVARTLPDRFFVRVEQDGSPPETRSGRAIPDELPIGLTSRDELTALQVEGADLPPVDESLGWLVDYKAAEDVGMAVTVDLPQPGEDVRRLVVYGVRAALEPEAGAARLERLLRSHRFTDGAEFLAQGTPTNNTDSVRTEWSRRTPPGAPELDPDAGIEGGANAAVTAAALGVDRDLLASLPGGRDAEQGRAAAFNTALWTTTWGDAIEHLTPGGRANGDKRLDNPSLDAVRDHWVDHVRGRGPLPALRLGRQPYGLLPVVATDGSWAPLRGGFVEERLVPFIDQQVRWMWNQAAGSVPTVMNRPLDAAMKEILGTDAVLRGLRVRTALAPDSMLETAMALTLPDLGDHRIQQQVTHALLLLAGVGSDALDENDLLGTKTRTLALPLVHETDLEFVAGLLEEDPPPMPHRSVLQVLLAHAHAIERHNRETMAPRDKLDLLTAAVSETRVEVDRDLVTAALTAVVSDHDFSADVVAAAAEHVTAEVGRLDSRAIADRHPFPAVAPADKVEQVAGTEGAGSYLTGQLGMQLVGEIFHGARWAAEFRAALKTISQIESIDERRLLLCETLDCCSHRLDAWIGSAASRRLGDLRADGAEGAFIGAYGVLENIALSAPEAGGVIDGIEVLHDPQDAGYVHAPGLTHAATAGVLRSGRLTHHRGDPAQEALEIDLSSTRMRDAASLLEGMRRGQSLGALLGYRLERRLHERSGGELELDRFIYVLRSLAPLRAGKLTDPGEPVQEGLAASDVVDGLRLMELPESAILAKLDAGPDDDRYINPPGWVAPQPGEAAAVIAAIKELKQTHDAVADLLLAESVHQTVSGNPARAAATLDLVGAGEAAPPEPEILRTPRTGIPIQHRVAILVPRRRPEEADGWSSDAARARAEPRLETWARGALGDPSELVLDGVGHTLAEAGLSALDVIYDADGESVGTSTLAARLRRDIDGLAGDLAPLAPLWELAGMLRAMLLGGRPLDVADVGRPTEEGATGRAPDAEELLERAQRACHGLDQARQSAQPIARLAAFGVRPPPASDALPLSPDEVAESREALIAEATKRLEAAQALVDRAAATTEPRQVVELASQALGTVFGSGFLAVPLLKKPPAGEADLWTGGVGPHGVEPSPGRRIRPWLARAGALRERTSAYGEALLVREALGGRPLLRAVQTPAGAYDRWVGMAFGNEKPPMTPLSSMVAEVAGARAGEPGPRLGGVIAGVVLDEWTEVLPRRLERGDPDAPAAEPELVDVTTTGVALHANAPGARPPQAILVALSPDGGGWTGDRLVALIDETMALARMRGVTLQQLPYAGRYLPALYFRDWSLQGEPAINWLQVATEFDANYAVNFLAVDQ